MSDFRHVPDHQEVWADADSDQSVVIEVLERQDAVADADIARYLFDDLAAANEASESAAHGAAAEVPPARRGALPADAPVWSLRGTQRVAKHREDAAASNAIHVAMGVVRLAPVASELCVTVSCPTDVSPLSSSAHAAAAAAAAGGSAAIATADATLREVLASMQIRDMGLFG